MVYLEIADVMQQQSLLINEPTSRLLEDALATEPSFIGLGSCFPVHATLLSIKARIATRSFKGRPWLRIAYCKRTPIAHTHLSHACFWFLV
mmetsp:Transcript_39169/g.90448  ORF Transcript_39169/g.90448 Transcript_39169/m.90448 type:complete len:91 (-) Transcript_39169:390-662(-)